MSVQHDDMYQVSIEEIALTSLRLSGMEDAIAERDAEIAALRAELAGVIEGHKAAVELWDQQDYDNYTEIAALKRRVNEADQIVRAGEAERKALAAQVAELQATVKKWNDVGTGILFFLNGRPGMDSYAMESFVDSLPKQVIGAMGHDPYEGTTFIRLSDVPD